MDNEEFFSAAKVIEIAKDLGIHRGGLQANVGIARADLDAMNLTDALNAMVALMIILEAAEAVQQQ